MREVPEVVPPAKASKLLLIVAAVLLLGLGVLAGSLLFPVVEVRHAEKRVEIPVEVIKYVDRVVEKRVEVPVEKIVEKRVEVPVEVIRYVEKSASSSVASQPIAERTSTPEALDTGYHLLKVGMTMAEVKAIVGQPYYDDGAGRWFYYSVRTRKNINLQFHGDRLLYIQSPS